MSFTYIQKLPTPDEMIEEIPMPADLVEVKKKRDRMIADVFTGADKDRFVVIVGPCSADNEDAVCDYVSRLASINDKISDRLVIIPRIYTNKPRTNGDGYKGIASQPDPKGEPDFRAGVAAMRHMHIRVIKESDLTSADEMLYPDNWGFVSDILSYAAIGARSVEDQHHRMTASGFDVPAGMKNPTSGDLTVTLNSVYAAQRPHDFSYRGYEVKTNGNPLAHVVLRGASNKTGQAIPNYHYEDLCLLKKLYDERDLANPACIVDANHSNSDKQFKEQIRIVKEVLLSRKHNDDIRNLVKGVMIESYIEEGNQKIGEGVYGKSITDPCLGWADTERLLLEMAELV
ncbi:MAG: 3-deoxy-7-phosphoheptulonate synthase [Lachnospiraceae bacterium]|nr:3-deoxy-7-phosphoheptulonate synthase [Lachnospiraceae bacterium]